MKRLFIIQNKLLWLLAGLSFLAGMILFIFSPDFEALSSWEVDSHSPSALGNKALVDLLKQTDHPVIISHYQSEKRASKHSILTVISPDLNFIDSKYDMPSLTVEDFKETKTPTILILPKRIAHDQSSKNPDWLEEHRLFDINETNQILQAIIPSLSTTRSSSTGSCFLRGSMVNLVLPEPQFIHIQDYDGLFTPLLECTGGIVAGIYTKQNIDYSYNMEFQESQTLIISDSDLLLNWNIGKGDNAAISLEVLDRFAQSKATLLIDETHHGFIKPRSIWRLLFDLPLLPVTFSVLLTLGFLLWFAMVRFQDPEKEPPELLAGSRFLIQNTSQLLGYAQLSEHAVEKYFHHTLQDVAKQCHIHSTRTTSELIQKLEALQEARKISSSIKKIELELVALRSSILPQQKATRKSVSIALELYNWKKEILNQG